jgi:hypothetical protein
MNMKEIEKPKEVKECPCYHSERPCNVNCSCHNPYMSGACFKCENGGIGDLEQLYLAMKYKDSRERNSVANDSQ